MFASHNTKARSAFVTAIIAALLIAFSPNLHAQSPLTVQPSTGRVGVGNTNPTETLDVTGNIKNSGTLNATGNITTSGSLSVGTTAQTGAANRFRHLNSMVSVELSASQTIADSTFTAINWDVESFDTDNLHNSTNKSRFTVALTGKYLIAGGPTFTPSSGAIITEVWINGGTTKFRLFEVAVNGTAYIPARIITIMPLSAGDYIEFYAWQNSGGNLDIFGDATNSARSTAMMAYIGE